MSADTLRVIFDQYDTEGLGHLDAKAFRQFLEELGRTGISEEQFQTCFDCVDKYGTGVISKENFVEFVPYLYEVDFKPQKVEKSKKKEINYDPKDPASFFVKVKKIGKGSYGMVYKAIDMRSNQVIALKIIDIEGSEEEVEEVQREVAFQAHCKSPYITQYFGSYLKGTELWIAMEFVGGGSCLDLLKAGVPSEKQIRVLLKQTLLGLDYLHTNKKMHRDIKAGNILLTPTGDVKLADFGVAAQIYQTVAAQCTFAGTPLWMAPEVILQQPQTAAVDIWSLGITAIELAKGFPPKHDLHPMQVLFSVPDDPPPVLEGEFSEQFKHFVSVCLQKNPKDRPTAAQLLKHPFVQTEDSNSILTELVQKYEAWKESSPKKQQQTKEQDSVTLQKKESRTVDWDFETRNSEDSGEGSEDDLDEDDEEEPEVQVTPEKPKVVVTQEDLDSPLGLTLQRFKIVDTLGVLKENDIDLDAMMLLKEIDFKEIGIKLGTRKKMEMMIKTLKEEKKGKKRKSEKIQALPMMSTNFDSIYASDPKELASPSKEKENKEEKEIKEKEAKPNLLDAIQKTENRVLPFDPKKWQVEDVEQWMKRCGFAEYSANFVKNQIDGKALFALEHDTLKELGMDLVGTRVKFVVAVEELKPEESRRSMSTVFDRPAVPVQLEKKKSGLFPRMAFSGKKKSADNLPTLQIPPTSANSSAQASPNSRGSSSSANPKEGDLQEALSKMGSYQRAKTQDVEKVEAGKNVELPAPDITADQIQNPDFAGWLIKQGGQRKNWKKRWFVLKDCVLYYFPTNKGTKAKGMIMLPSYNLWVAKEIKKKYAFKAVHVSARTYYFVAQSYEDMKKWMKYMHEAAVISKPAATIPAIAVVTTENGSDGSLPGTPKGNRLSKDNPSLEDAKGKESEAAKEIQKAAEEKKKVDLSVKKRDEGITDPNVLRFLDVLIYVNEEELRPFFEIAKKDVDQAVGAYYASKAKKN